jgi:hypothetical protein
MPEKTMINIRANNNKSQRAAVTDLDKRRKKQTSSNILNLEIRENDFLAGCQRNGKKMYITRGLLYWPIG